MARRDTLSIRRRRSLRISLSSSLSILALEHPAYKRSHSINRSFSGIHSNYRPAFVLFPRVNPMPPPTVTLTTPHSPARARSVSQPIREDVATDFTYPAHTHEPRTSILRSHSSNSVMRATGSSINTSAASPNAARSTGRARSSSLVAVTEVGGDEPENVVDRLGVGSNENAAWVNAPGEFARCYENSLDC